MWPKAVVTKQLDERSYLVETDHGSYRRNRIDIKKTQEGQLADALVEPNSTTIKESQAKATPMKPVVPDTVSAKNKVDEPVSDQSAVEKPQRPKRSVREPAYLKDYVRK